MTSYKAAGVDIEAGNELVRRLKKHCPSIGGFGGLFPFGDHYLIGGADGVGTKLKVAFELNKHDTIGIDLVAMCANDVLTSGAKPLFFLDYYASSTLDVDLAETVIAGIARACESIDCTLMGGETAEMPGFYHDGEYDLSGFCVGAVEKKAHINGKTINKGDWIIGLPSSGIHSNGFSLARKIIANSPFSLHDQAPFAKETIGNILLTPTKLYVNEVLNLCKKFPIKGMAHITGGGLIENVPRILPKGLGLQFMSRNWQIPALFSWMQETGSIPNDEMRKTFNLGIGYAIVCDAEHAEAILEENPQYAHIASVTSEQGLNWQ